MRWNLAVAALATSWGFISVIVVGVTLDPLPLTVDRTGLAVLAIVVLLALTRRLDLLRVPRERALLAFSGALLAAHWWCYFETIKLAGAAVANFTVYTAPILLAAVAPLVLPETRSRVVLAALAPGSAGLLLIALAGGGGGRHVRPLAIVVVGDPRAVVRLAGRPRRRARRHGRNDDRRPRAGRGGGGRTRRGDGGLSR